MTGAGVVIGICDTGVDQTKIPAVIGGWSPDPNAPPGTDGDGHGTMCATDALGVCPDAKIVDIGVLKGVGGGVGVSGVLSDAIAAFDWALEQYRANGQPQVLVFQNERRIGSQRRRRDNQPNGNDGRRRVPGTPEVRT